MRARNIKPGYYQNEDLAECSVWARYIFPGLWMMADREGRLEDRPKRIKRELIPSDNQDVEPLLAELAQRGFIIRYQKDGASYIQISAFWKHQSPHYSEKKSVIPPPDNWESGRHDDQHAPGKLSPKEVSGFQEDSGSSPGKPSSSRGGRNALNHDSLIPDSLNPEEEDLSGSPSARPDIALVPPEQPGPRFAGRRQVAAEILAYLNERAGKRFEPTDTNLEFIMARLREGASKQQCIDVIQERCAKWLGTDSAEYLRPATLFNRTKFAQYVGNIGTLPGSAGSQAPNPFAGGV